ncbi:peptidoglycan-binding protein [Mariprofundus sp. KV]|nr:peptidoglycan-binding protein [Mariprofundus sp. KV]
MFMRGKGVSMLQELLQRMGYPMQDQPGLFGVATRAAVKDFQAKKGLKSTGIVDEALLDLMRQNFTTPTERKKSKAKSAQTPAPHPATQQQLDTITRLLIKKGIFSEEELAKELSRPHPVRITQPPLT